jgi:dienelactone hydrolase
MSARTLFRLLCVSVPLWLAPSVIADPLPNTKPLTDDGDLAAAMVAGIHKYLDRELKAAPAKRDELWKANAKEPLAAKRDRLRKLLGVVDERVKPNLEYVSGPGKPSLLAEIDGCKVHAVRWAVLPGVDAEGLLIEPKDKPKANVVAIPHADQLPEELAGLVKGDPFALNLARHGCRVLVPTLINRSSELSGNPKLKRQTNIPHREFVYRMAYEMGRTLTGYEVQKVLAAVDWFQANDAKLKVGVIGYGDGGMAALCTGALSGKVHSVSVSGYLESREAVWSQPIDRNIWGLLNEFGDAEVARLAGENTFLSFHLGHPTWDGPVQAKSGRSGAAPGALAKAEATSVESEYGRFTGVSNIHQRAPGPFDISVSHFADALEFEWNRLPPAVIPDKIALPDPTARHKRQFDQLVAFTQKLWRDSDAVRNTFWKKADASSPAKWEASCDWYREYFHSEVIGKLPEPTVPLNPRSRQVYDEKTFTGYEVKLDVYDDVFASGILLLPKDLKPTEKRPVVVCQHGLEGTPRKCIDAEKGPTYFEFARKLVEKGYVVYCPQNPYYGGNTFRQIQRKANPLKLSLFSFIIRQHQRTLDFIEKLPGVDPKRIGFYGLSYGGKTAMRVPAVEKRYCLSICSGDFNEWVGKNVSVDLDRSYMWTGEYEMYEFDLGHTFNYAEMAYLIAPRPFMVERGHDDGVGTDDMVSSEFGKVRYLYANRLKVADRTAIDYQVGGHQIFLKGTMEFIEKWLGKAR